MIEESSDQFTGGVEAVDHRAAAVKDLSLRIYAQASEREGDTC